MEKLNVSELKSLKDEIISQDNMGEKLIDSNKTAKVKVLVTDDGNINYSEKHDDGSLVAISGNEVSGFTKKETKAGSPVEKTSEFFGNGNLKKTGDTYIEVKGVDPHGFTRAVGKWYTYDQKGNIVETKEFIETDFLFTLEDVNRYLEKNKLRATMIGKHPTVVINGKKIRQATWYITTMDDQSYVTIIILDGKTGKKIEETQKKIVR